MALCLALTHCRCLNSGSRCSDSHVTRLIKLVSSRLQRLSLAGTKVRGSMLPSCTSLRHLDLDACIMVSAKVIATCLGRCAGGLEVLRLAHTQVTTNQFMALPAFTSLTEVRLSHCPFINGNVMDVLLRTSLRLKHLEIADCPRVAFIDQGAT